jgi:heptosyltransferase III
LIHQMDKKNNYENEERHHVLKTKISFWINCFKLLLFVKRKNTIAISLIEHMGDIIANEPISREARKQHPASTIIWFVRKPYKDLLKYNPSVNKVYTVHCLTSWIWLKERFTFKSVYDLHFNGRSCNICNWSLIKNDTDDSVNGMNYFNFGGLLKAVCKHNKMEVDNEYPELYIPDKYFKSVSKKISFKKYIVIHCNSNESIKNWTNAKWSELISKIISEFKYMVIEVGNESKLQLNNPCYLNLCGELRLMETAALIKNATLFIGIDSGPAHMANAAGVPGVILLGDYYFNMSHYNPYSGNYLNSKKCKLVYSENEVKNISVDQVLDNIWSLLKN